MTLNFLRQMVFAIALLCLIPTASAQEECTAEAGTVNGKSRTQVATGIELLAAQRTHPNIPEGSIQRFVLTKTDDLIIIGLGEEPKFIVDEEGVFRIHSFVFPANLDLGVVEFGTTTGVDVLNLLNENEICADLDVEGARFEVDRACRAIAGKLEADDIEEEDGDIEITAERKTHPNVPPGFIERFVLTTTDNLVIVGLGEEAEFTVTESGRYRIHSFVFPEELDLSGVELGTTTGVDVLNLIAENGICADLDVEGALFDVEQNEEEECTAEAGTLNGKSRTQVATGIELLAVQRTHPNIPEGSIQRFVLTKTDDLIIIGLGEEPKFIVDEEGVFRIHSFVFPANLDLGVVEFGTTTGVDVLNLLNENEICADLDVEGARFEVDRACRAIAGKLEADDIEEEDGDIEITAERKTHPNVPPGFIERFVLTTTDNLVIVGLGEEAEFTVTESGRYRIHSFVFPEDLDLSGVELGTTTGVDVLNLIADNGICADLDVEGALFDVEIEECTADAGELDPEGEEVVEGGVKITAEIDDEPNVPEGFVLRYES